MPKLKNIKWERFAREYLIDCNKTQAAIRAGYSKKTAYAKGHELSNIPEIKLRINELMQEDMADVQQRRYKVLKELDNLAFADRTELVQYNSAGEVIITPTEELSSNQRKLVAGIEQGLYGTKIRLYDKLKALELYSRILGLTNGLSEDSAALEKAKELLEGIDSVIK